MFLSALAEVLLVRFFFLTALLYPFHAAAQLCQQRFVPFRLAQGLHKGLCQGDVGEHRNGAGAAAGFDHPFRR